MMPKLDGFALCAELRRLASNLPVLMLTAKGQIEDRVTGLDVGADDYLVKPFSTEELLARVRALLRRVERKTKSPVKLKLGDMEIDLARQTALRGKKPIHLTAQGIRHVAADGRSRRRTGHAAKNFSTWSGATRRFPRRARWTTTSPACAPSWRKIPTSRAGSRPCMAWATNWKSDFAKA